MPKAGNEILEKMFPHIPAGADVIAHLLLVFGIQSWSSIYHVIKNNILMTLASTGWTGYIFYISTSIEDNAYMWSPLSSTGTNLIQCTKIQAFLLE